MCARNPKRGTKRSKFIGLALAVGLMVALGLPGGAPQAAKMGGEITVGIDTDAKGWDPHKATAFTSFSFFEHVYECPIRYDAKGAIIGSLATSWETPNDKTIIFKIL